MKISQFCSKTIHTIVLAMITFSSKSDALATPEILISVKGGGKNPSLFCIPELSISNNTDKNIPALLIQLEWRDKNSGEILQATGESGSIIENLTSGKTREILVSGFSTDCNSLELQVKKYACRDENIVKMFCPAAIKSTATGGIIVNTSEMREDKMKGVVELRQ